MLDGAMSWKIARSANRKLSRYDRNPARMPFRFISFQKETD